MVRSSSKVKEREAVAAVTNRVGDWEELLNETPHFDVWEPHFTNTFTFHFPFSATQPVQLIKYCQIN
jgi:hypothetical protein